MSQHSQQPSSSQQTYDPKRQALITKLTALFDSSHCSGAAIALDQPDPDRQRRCAVKVRGINTQPVQNRLVAAMIHTTRYAFKGKARLAADCGVAPSTACRLILGQCSPSFSLVAAVTQALEKQLGRTIDPRELVSRDGVYPTPSICALCGCRGCLPDEAYDEHERLKSEYKHLKPGGWTTLSSQFIQQVLQEEEESEAEKVETTRKATR